MGKWEKKKKERKINQKNEENAMGNLAEDLNEHFKEDEKNYHHAWEKMSNFVGDQEELKSQDNATAHSPGCEKVRH